MFKKLMWNLNLSQLNSNNCYDSMIYPMLSHQNYDPHLASLSCFSSVYYDEDHKRLIRERRLNHFLNGVLGININFLNRNDAVTDVIHQIKRHLAESPVGIYVDSYECSWMSTYQKLHYEHFFLIVDDISEEKQILCVDVYFKDIGYFKLSYEELLHIYDSIITFTFPDKRQFEKDKIQQYLTNSFILPDIFAHNKQKEALIHLFTQCLTPEEIFGIGLNYSIILLKLGWIAEDKGNFLTALQFLDGYTASDFTGSLSHLLQGLRKDFLLLKNMMIKYTLTGMKNDEKIIAIIEQVSTADLLVIEKMQDMLKNN